MSVDKNLAQTTVEELLAVLGAGGYLAQTAHQCGIYVNAALGAAWVDLASPDFDSMGAAGVGGPVACDANLDFTEVSIRNYSANTVFLVFRPHYVGPAPGFVPEDPALTAWPIAPGETLTKACSLVDAGAVVGTISIIASGAGSSVWVGANFASR